MAHAALNKGNSMNLPEMVFVRVCSFVFSVASTPARATSYNG